MEVKVIGFNDSVDEPARVISFENAVLGDAVGSQGRPVSCSIHSDYYEGFDRSLIAAIGLF